MEVYDLTKLIEILVGVAVGLSNIIIGLSVYKLSIISFSHQGVLPEWKKNNLVAILELKRNILESKLNIGFFCSKSKFYYSRPYDKFPLGNHSWGSYGKILAIEFSKNELENILPFLKMRYDCRLPNNIKVCISKLFKSDDLNLNEFLKRGDENSLTILETYSADESKYKYNKILDNTKEYDKIYSKTYWIYYDDIKEFQKDYKNLVESINEWFSKNGLVDEVL